MIGSNSRSSRLLVRVGLRRHSSRALGLCLSSVPSRRRHVDRYTQLLVPKDRASRLLPVQLPFGLGQVIVPIRPVLSSLTSGTLLFREVREQHEWLTSALNGYCPARGVRPMKICRLGNSESSDTAHRQLARGWRGQFEVCILEASSNTCSS